MYKKESKNNLLDKVIEICNKHEKGKVLDLGCGNGDYSVKLKELGFDVIAGDMDVERFRYKDKIKFKTCHIAQKLPFENNTFDYILFIEVIEHLQNPYEVISELRRVLKNGGKLILSTPNILNLKSRMRYLIEGCWEFFREIPLEHSKNPNEVIWNLHLIPWRYHELEYMLHSSNLNIKEIHTSVYTGKALAFLLPIIYFQLGLKENRIRRKGGMDQSRINKILLSKEILFGKHLIVLAEKGGTFSKV